VTVLLDVNAAPREDIFTAAGTTVPDTRGRPNKFLATVLMAGLAASGTVAAGAAGADAAAFAPVVQQPSTLSGLPAHSPIVVDVALVEEVLQRVRRTSGLSWGDVARAMGVSRRTIHNWLNGARIAGVHLDRLLDLDRIVRIAGSVGRPDDVRARLLLPGPHGRSIVDEMALAARPARRIPLASTSIGDQLAPIADEPTIVRPPRRSGLVGGSVPRRQR